MRSELAQKNVEIVELENKLKQTQENSEEYKRQFEKVKRDFIQFKRQ